MNTEQELIKSFETFPSGSYALNAKDNLSEEEAKQLSKEIQEKKKANVCTNCGKPSEYWDNWKPYCLNCFAKIRGLI